MSVTIGADGGLREVRPGDAVMGLVHEGDPDLTRLSTCPDEPFLAPEQAAEHADDGVVVSVPQALGWLERFARHWDGSARSGETMSIAQPTRRPARTGTLTVPGASLRCEVRGCGPVLLLVASARSPTCSAVSLVALGALGVSREDGRGHAAVPVEATSLTPVLASG